MIKLQIFTTKYINNLLEWFKNPNNRGFMLTKTMSREETYKFIISNKNRKLYVILKEKQPIGYCMLKDIEANPKIGIMIDKKYQNKGMGKIAMKKLEKEAKRLGCKKLGLMVDINNTKAINFYKKLNYIKKFLIMDKNL